MLQPARERYRKQQRGRMKGTAHRGNQVAFGEYGLKALTPGWLSSNQIEAARVAITRHVKRGGKLWIRVFPHKSVTSQPLETPMGKGKGSPESHVAVVKPGHVLFEIEGISRELAKEAMRLAGHKLSVRTRFVVREETRTD